MYIHHQGVVFFKLLVMVPIVKNDTDIVDPAKIFFLIK